MSYYSKQTEFFPWKLNRVMEDFTLLKFSVVGG